MELKYYTWIFIILAFLIHSVGFVNLLTIITSFVFFVLGILTVVYVQRGDYDKFIAGSEIRNPLDPPKTLGLNLVDEKKPIVLISPNVKIQTETKKHRKTCSPQHSSNIQKTSLGEQQQKQQQSQKQLPIPVTGSGNETRKKSLIDSGIELLFKKHGKNIKDGHLKVQDVYLENSKKEKSSGGSISDSDKRWKPFENIKIYTDHKKKTASNVTSINSSGNDRLLFGKGESVQYGEDCSASSSTGNNPKYNVTFDNDAHLLNENGSPKTKKKSMLSGNKQIDQLLHTIIDYVIRDFIDSWFCLLSDNKEFGDFRVRNCIEECVLNVCNRTKNTDWVPLMTTKLIDNIANHTRIYRLANQAISNKHSPNINNNGSRKDDDISSPHRKSRKPQHKRNKSDTDLQRYFVSTATSIPHKSVANSKFYDAPVPEEKTLVDPEEKLLNAFFNQNNLYRKECMDDLELEKYLTHVMETILYFTLPQEDFACLPLRTFLSTLLANVLLKPMLDMLSDPDFINLQVAKLISKDLPPVEYFIKALRQSTDLSELRACRQIITKEMNVKHKDPTATAELASLKYTQKIIDLRLNFLQTTKFSQEKQKSADIKLQILPLDVLLFKELPRSYFLDYLSVLNLQKYVIFYLTADEWKLLAGQAVLEIQNSKISKSSKDEKYINLRERAQNIFQEYLQSSSQNFLQINAGLIEAIAIKLRDPMITPESNWFDSICKFVYEKLKNEDIFLPKFYQSTAYRNLMLELEDDGQSNESDIELNINALHTTCSETGSASDSNSGDIKFDEMEHGDHHQNLNAVNLGEYSAPANANLLDVGSFKHARSHSDCTGIVQNYDDQYSGLTMKIGNGKSEDVTDRGQDHPLAPQPPTVLPKNNFGDFSHGVKDSETGAASLHSSQQPEITINDPKQKLIAKIINTAILCEGQYAVYAIQVSVVEDNHQKSWHIYRRYSKFLELKKLLTKKYPIVSKLPFPAKKAFQNTQRSVLEHRMVLLNEFLRILCMKAEENTDVMKILREFLEPDTDDRKIHGGVVTRTIETIVNPFKTGIRTIKSMPDTLVGGFSKILLGKGPLKEPSFLQVNSIYLEQSSEYPALTSALHLLDEVFDLQARSQWLRRGIINRLLGAPWVSHAANKRILHGAKSLIEVDKIEHLLTSILNSIWPNGIKLKRSAPREDNTKLRTRVAARMALFALLSDDLKHVVGSETTRSGLLNFFSMWQHKKLNLRLALVLLNDVLTTLYRVDSMTKHVKD